MIHTSYYYAYDRYYFDSAQIHIYTRITPTYKIKHVSTHTNTLHTDAEIKTTYVAQNKTKKRHPLIGV